jgi:class 3 adenylate cyclase
LVSEAGRVDDPLAEGRTALARRDWPVVHELWAGIDQATLTATDLAGLADAELAMGSFEAAMDIQTRAHARYRDEGDLVGAAYAAMLAGIENAVIGEIAVAGGWFATARELMEGIDECRAHALVPFIDYFILLRSGDLDGALTSAEQIEEIARRVGDRDLELVGQVFVGQARARRGEIEDGLALIDKAMVAAVSGQVGPFAFGQMVCQTLTACQQVGDLRRAFEWLESVERASVIHGIELSSDCKVHRAGILKLRGSWARAEAEARNGCVRHPHDEHLGWGWCEIGDIHRRMGDLAGAEEAFTLAYEKGYVPHPGLALLRLAQGDVAAARDDIEQAYGAAGSDLAVRAELLDARVTIALAAGDLDLARQSADELARDAAACGSATFLAAAACADGRVKLAEGDRSGAASALESGVASLLELGLPYETALARVDLAIARLALDDRNRAVMDLRSARSVFSQLGAALDESRATDLLDDLSEATATDRAPTEKTFMFTDIERSTLLLEALGDRDWDDLLRWHDRTLRDAMKSNGGQEVKHEGDGFFVAFDDPADAIDCAVSIQQQLARHRHDHGFSPRVRIGLHAGEAVERDGDFFGMVVNTTARVMSLAEGGEILASASIVPDERRADVPREERLKGVSDPVTVVAVRW